MSMETQNSLHKIFIFPAIANKTGMDLRISLQYTLLQALRLCTGHTAHRGSRGLALPFHDHDTRKG